MQVGKFLREHQSQVIPVVALAAILAILGLAFFWINSGKSGLSGNTLATTDSQYLNLSRQIIDEIDRHTDARGFYGQSHLCTKSGHKYTCHIDLHTLENGEQAASHRQTLAVIWAKYQYFHTTGDQNILKSLISDVEHMHALLTNPAWTLQTNRYNCMMMADLALADDLPEGITDMARDICNYGYFEIYPESDVTFDQHYHPVYSVAPAAGDEHITDEVIVYSNPELHIDPRDRATYDENDVRADIVDMLHQYAADGTIMRRYTDTAHNFFYTYRFLTRELYAALDQAKAWELNLKTNPDRAAQNKLDYLLLTRETLQWFADAGANAFGGFDADSCLIDQNIRYFLDNFDHDLSPHEQTAINTRFADNKDFTMYSPGCSIAAHQLNGYPLEAAGAANDIYLNNEYYGIKDWSAGYLFSAGSGDNQYVNLVEPNAWAAGILAHSHEQ